MKRTTARTILSTIIFLALISFCLQASAQEKDKHPAPGFYKLDFTVYEVADGKRSNPHTYTLMLSDDERDGSIRVGNRVPIVTGSTKDDSKQFQYIDIGFNLNARLRSTETGLSLHANFESSSMALSDQNTNNSDPLIRQFKGDAMTIIEFGKPTVISSIDDVSSNKRMQIEVTVTKLK